MFEDGTLMTVKTSIAEVEATPKTFWYDATVDIVYIHPTSNGDPADYEYEIGEDWDGFLTDCKNDAMQLIDGWLNKKYTTPLIARDNKDHSTDDYEFPIKRSCAALTCYFIINRRNPGDPEAMDLYKIAWNNNPEEVKGYINMYLDNELVRQDTVTDREAFYGNIFPTSGNTTAEPGVIVSGIFTGATFQIWLLTITTGGAPGTAKFKLSLDNGTTDTYTGQDTLKSGSDIRVPLSHGLYATFPASSYTANDTWTIEAYPQDSSLAGGNKIRSITLTR